MWYSIHSTFSESTLSKYYLEHERNHDGSWLKLFIINKGEEVTRVNFIESFFFAKSWTWLRIHSEKKSDENYSKQGTSGFEKHIDHLFDVSKWVLVPTFSHWTSWLWILFQSSYLVRKLKERPDVFYMVFPEPECVNVCFWYIPERLRNVPHGPEREAELGKVSLSLSLIPPCIYLSPFSWINSTNSPLTEIRDRSQHNWKDEWWMKELSWLVTSHLETFPTFSETLFPILVLNTRTSITSSRNWIDLDMTCNHLPVNGSQERNPKGNQEYCIKISLLIFMWKKIYVFVGS